MLAREEMSTFSRLFRSRFHDYAAYEHNSRAEDPPLRCGDLIDDGSAEDAGRIKLSWKFERKMAADLINCGSSHA